MGPTHFYGARAEPPPLQKADFAMKQTNICRRSGDITTTVVAIGDPFPSTKTLKIKGLKSRIALNGTHMRRDEIPHRTRRTYALGQTNASNQPGRCVES